MRGRMQERTGEARRGMISTRMSEIPMSKVKGARRKGEQRRGQASSTEKRMATSKSEESRGGGEERRGEETKRRNLGSRSLLRRDFFVAASKMLFRK